jgi:hypothetical protein
VQGTSYEGEHAPINVPRLNPRGDLSLKVRDQTGSIRIATVGAIPQTLKQLLQDKQVTEGQLLVPPGGMWRAAPSNATTCGELSRYRSRSDVSTGGRPLAMAPALCGAWCAIRDAPSPFLSSFQWPYWELGGQ